VYAVEKVTSDIPLALVVPEPLRATVATVATEEVEAPVWVL
jgi:hypothetical protein